MGLVSLSSATAVLAVLIALGTTQQVVAEPLQTESLLEANEDQNANGRSIFLGSVTLPEIDRVEESEIEESETSVTQEAESALVAELVAPLSAAGVSSAFASSAEFASDQDEQSSQRAEAVPEAESEAESEPTHLTNEATTDVGAIEQEASVELNAGLNQISQIPEFSIGSITSVSQLADVQPTDWAYQAVQSLVERYGCIVGYPDQTFRGNQSLTRYEFAAGLNACLDNITGLLASATDDFATQEDLATLQRLQEEFASELAALRERVDALESRTATLEAQQFSTTTVLRGNVWFNLTQAFPTGDILAERSLFVPGSAFAPPTRDANNRPTRVEHGQPQLTGSYYTWLTLTSSFNGNDALVLQLAVGNGNSPANQLVSSGFFNSWGVPFLDQTGTPTPGEFVVRELFYSFPVGNSLQVDVGPQLNYYRYFDGNRFTFFQTGASSFNSSGSTLLNAIDRGTGVVFQWQIVEPLELTLGYMAENTEFLNPVIFNTATDPQRGLFNGSNTISAQLEFQPVNNFSLRLIYARSTLEPYNGFIGGAVGEPLPYGYADDGFGGTLNSSGADAFVANFDWLIANWIGIFGRYSYGRLDINPVNEARSEGEVRVQSFQVGLGFPDLGKEGALGVISFLVPHDYLEGRRFLLSGGGDGGTQYELEASYRYPINANISLVPSFYTIWNANNFDANPTVFVSNLRMQFTF